MIVADSDAAFAAYRAASGTDAEDEASVARTAFALLNAYGRRDAAIRLGRARLTRTRDDPIQRYLFDAAAGEKLDRAPRDYLIAHFDCFADTFDKQLVDVLGYDVPERLARLVGVDLSPRMLAKAAKRRAYDALVEADMIAFLAETDERFDLVFVADALIYFGALDEFFAAAARVMPEGALLAFNVETIDAAPFALLPSGRFAVVQALGGTGLGVALGSRRAGRRHVAGARAPRRLTPLSGARPTAVVSRPSGSSRAVRRRRRDRLRARRRRG